MKYFLKRFLLAIGLLVCGAAPSFATMNASSTGSGDSAQFAGWLDREGLATVETVQQLAEWESFTGWKGWAFGPESLWLRVRVPAVTETDARPFILVMRPPFLDEVVFYDPVMGTRQRAGDFFPVANEVLDTVLFTFAVPPSAQERDIFLKVTSTSTRTVHLSLMSEAQAKVYTRWVEWVTGTVLVLSFVFVVWAMVQWWLTRDQVMGAFALRQGMIVLWGFFLLGFARLSMGSWFDPGSLSLITSMVVAGALGSTLWFYAKLLQEYQSRPWMLKTLQTCAWIVMGMILLMLAGQVRPALQIINFAAPWTLLWIVLTLCMARTAPIQPDISKWLLLSYLCLYAVLNALPPLTYLGLIQESPILFVGNMGVLVVDGLVMIVILSVRQRRFQAAHQTVATQLIFQQEQARLDKQYLEEQRKLLAMLAHEMKTPLANLRLWMEAGPEGRPVMEEAIQDMNRVIERCVHSGQLADESLKPRNVWMDAAEQTQAVSTAGRYSSRVELHLREDVCDLYADQQMLCIVLSNILENACKYSAPDTPIDIRLEPQASPQGVAGWRWQIHNAVGEAGYPDGQKVFDKYYRGPFAQRQSGSGLGLFLVKSLLDHMGGSVQYVPLKGRVCFEVWLPREGGLQSTR